MFGYVRPLRAELKVGQWEDYQAAYCGLCHTLARRCGWKARFVLNYDFTFLTLLLDDNREKTVCSKRCISHPLRPRPCLSGTGSMDLAADESVILTYYKLLDGRADEGFWKAVGYGLAAWTLKRAYRKAAKRQPDFDRHVAGCLERLATLEEANSPELDRTADAFATLLQGAAPETDAPERQRPLAQLLYHLGRWIYLIDAVDDLAEDEAKGRYNPIAARFQGVPDLDYMATTMTHSLSLAQSAFQLLPPTRWQGILENILYLGLPAIQRRVFAGDFAKQDKRVRSMP